MNQTGAIYAGIIAAMGVAGVAATYRRGDVSVELTALPGRSGQSNGGREMAPIQLADADYIVQTSALDELGLPVEGDRLTVDIGGRLQVLSLQQIPTGERAWSYLPGNEFVRLHLTYVSDEVGSEVDHETTPSTPVTSRPGLKWFKTHTVTSVPVINLARSVATGDVLQLVVDHGTDQRTLTYLSGVDFTLVPDSSINVTGLSISVGDTLQITNFGKPRG